MENNEEETNNVVFFSPEGYIPENMPAKKFFNGDSKTSMDKRPAMNVLTGENNFKIDSLNKMGKALKVKFLVIPIPESVELERYIDFFADKCKYFWKIPSNKVAKALGFFLRSVARETRVSIGLLTALYEFVCEIIGCCRGGSKDTDLISFVEKCTKEAKERDVKDLLGEQKG